MHWTLAQSDDETTEIRDFVRKGQLFAAQDWIAARKPIHKEGSRKQQPLQIAVEHGFHSMVQVIATAWPDPQLLGAALNQAARKRRVDLVWLLLELGADIKSVDLGGIAECNDKDLMRFFFDRWDKVESERGLTELVSAMPRPLIGLIREYAPRLPDSQMQLAEALKFFVKENHPKWTALTIWMGGDPRLPAPDGSRLADEPENWTSALQDAIFEGNREALRLMAPCSKLDDLDGLLSDVSFFGDRSPEVAEYLLQCGANINNKPNGGSSILDSLFTAARFRHGLYSGRFGHGDIESIKGWISRGARWVPNDEYAFREVRAAIQGLTADEAWKFIGFLSETVDEALLTEICNTPKICKLLEVKPNRLKERIAWFNVKRQEAEERRSFFPRNPLYTTFIQRRPGILGIKETRTTK